MIQLPKYLCSAKAALLPAVDLQRSTVDHVPWDEILGSVKLDDLFQWLSLRDVHAITFITLTGVPFVHHPYLKCAV